MIELRESALRPIVRDDLEIGAGESVAVVGPSGSGKTSLLMIVAGLERATSGSVRVAGRDFLGLSEDELAIVRGSNIGIVFQSFHLVPTMTALENVALPLEFAGKPAAFATAKALLVEVGLAHRAEHFPAQLSGGEQQRVAIARALSPRPQIVLVLVCLVPPMLFVPPLVNALVTGAVLTGVVFWDAGLEQRQHARVSPPGPKRPAHS